MTNILFIHPNFPGQFKHIIPALRETGRYKLGYISRKRSIKDGEGILIEQYEFEKSNKKGVHRYLHNTHDAIRESRLVCICANKLTTRGFVPDIVVGHTAWGGLLFIKDMFPEARIIAYCELYSRPEFDHATSPKATISNDRRAQIRCKNFHPLMQMESMDVGITPTKWQLDSHPEIFQDKMVTVHEGVDTELCKPDESARFPIADKGLNLCREDTVITYVSRGFEPARGFFQYMQALEMLCAELPQAHFIMVGGEKSFYSGSSGDTTYKQQALDKYHIDLSRVHFTGRLIHAGFRKVLQISSAHVYLTRPLFLSWSAVEAMSMAAPIVASDEQLVREFMDHEQQGLLVDYFNPRNIADAVKRLVTDKTLAQRLGQSARKRVVENYDIKNTVTRWMEVIESLE